jgi:uncharacterized metal-binding protein YceD (DUF177 family)
MTSPLPPPEFSHTVPLSEIGSRTVHFALAANPEQRAALARRFGLLSLDALAGEIDLGIDDTGILATGTITASLSQACIISGEAVPAQIAEPFNVRFVEEAGFEPDSEIEIDADECDVIFHDGRVVDLGELVAQTLGLAIDPYPRSPNANAALKAAGVKDEAEAGPFAALAALRNKAD